MEIIFEFVAEIYVELIMALIPDKKLNKCVKFLLQFFCVIVSVAILLMLFCGIMMLVDPSFNAEGIEISVSPWLLIGIGAGLILIQISIVIFTEIKKKKKIDNTLQKTQETTEEDK